jgi:hypothetical protein
MADVSGKFFSAKKVRTGVSPSSPGVEQGETLPPVNPPGGGLNSVGLTMPSAFAVANSPLTSNGTIAVTGAGTVGQYVRGDGSLADFPESSGGGSSVSYYLNGSVNQGTIGGVAYKELNKVPILGTGTQFSIAADGYIASFLTDAGDPNLIEIPGGNWNFETYFSASSGGGSPTFYVELYKYNGTTFTLIASSVTSPELIAFGTNLTPYFSTLAVPTTTLALTDRLAIRYYVTHSGRTITMHTENNTLCQIITTFTTGITALNGLTAQVQNFAVGTTGTDFNIASATATHTFNLPTASASNRGALSSSDWTIFNNKENAITAGTTAQYFRGDKTFQTLNTAAVPENTNLYFTNARVLATALTGYTLGTNTALADTDTILGAFGKVQGQLNAKQNTLTNPVTGTGTTNYLPKFTGTTTIGNSAIQTNSNGDLMVGSADAGNAGSLNVSVGIAGDTSGGLQLWASNLATHYIQFGDGTTGEQAYAGYIGYSHSTNALVFGTDSGNRMRIFSDGNVSISNFPSNGGFKLDVNGTGRFIGNLTAASFIRSGGTSSQFLKADGSVDSTAYGTGSVTSVAALTLGTSGTDLSSTVANGTTTPVITLNVPTASATNRGALSAADWTAFNSKQQALNGTGFVKISGTTISYDNTSYLPLTGGTLTGTLNGTTAVFSNTVTGFQGTFTDGNQGLIIGYYTNGNGFGAIYPSTVTPNNSNYSFIAKNDSTVLHAATGGSVSLSINNVASLTIDSSRNAQLAGKFSLRADASASVTTQIPVFIANPSATTRELVTRTPAEFRSDIGAQAALTNPVTGSGTTNYLPKFTGASTIGNSEIIDNTLNVTIAKGNAVNDIGLIVQQTNNFTAAFINITANNDGGAGYNAIRSNTNGGTTHWQIDGGAAVSNFVISTGGTQRLRIDSSGNLGLGVTPSSWSVLTAMQIGNTSYANYLNRVYIGANWYYGSSADRYIASDYASLYQQVDGKHIFYTATSGTAGNAITFTQAMTLGSNSGLSIGTPSAAPAQGLLVQGNVIGNGRLLVGTATGVGQDFTSIRFSSADTFSQGLNMVDSNASSNGGVFQVFRKSNDTYIGLIRRHSTDDAILVSGNSYLSLGANNVENVRITSGGNVGIGTDSPSAMLTLLGLTPYIRIERSGVNTWQIQNNNQVGTITGFAINNITAGTVPFLINQATGNLLLGSTSDNGFRLDVNGTGRFSGNTTGAIATFINTNTAGTGNGILVDVNSQLGTDNYVMNLITNATSRMYVREDGNVGIDTTTPNSRLQVNGSLALPHTTKSANYTLTDSDYTVGFDCASNRTATLPDATTCAGRVYVIYQYNTGMGGSRYVTLDGNGSQTINGLTTASLQYNEDFSSVMIQSNGSNWIVIASSLYPSPL